MPFSLPAQTRIEPLLGCGGHGPGLEQPVSLWPVYYIVGSEVVYHDQDFEPLRNLFERFLKPEGEVILCEGIREDEPGFLQGDAAPF